MKEQFAGMFITEEELKNTFDKFYVQRQTPKIIKRASYESLRYGGADLVTAEIYEDKFYIRAFEFKLTDWRKALAQANENLKFAHQSFVVVPTNQVKNIYDSGKDYLNSHPYIGIISVDPESGKWKMEKYARYQNDESISLSQELLKFLLAEI